MNQSLHALTPLDGRYHSKVADLTSYFSEAALIRARIYIEVHFLFHLSQQGVIRTLSATERKTLKKLLVPSTRDIAKVKEIEEKTKHDVKAIEYFLQAHLTPDLIPFIHFGLTSEDTNNLAYRVLMHEALTTVVMPQLRLLLQALVTQIEATSSVVMLARTHGQPAVPTTFGKELAVFADRIFTQYRQLCTIRLKGKFSGAIGGYHAWYVSDPDRDWETLSASFIRSLGFEPVVISTQINPDDDIVELLGCLHHLNMILIGCCQDMWRYISDGWIKQRDKHQDVGSSTMPQKINPIEFENSEGNLKLASALIEELRRSLPISRLQRDLSDSTMKRSLGMVFGHSLLAYRTLTQALSKIEPDSTVMRNSLEANWNILSEALQTKARMLGNTQAYEEVAKLSKAKVWTKTTWQKLANDIAPSLASLTPAHYIGISVKLARQVTTTIKESDVFLS